MGFQRELKGGSINAEAVRLVDVAYCAHILELTRKGGIVFLADFGLYVVAYFMIVSYPLAQFEFDFFRRTSYYLKKLSLSYLLADRSIRSGSQS